MSKAMDSIVEALQAVDVDSKEVMDVDLKVITMMEI
jgi:hypothetical protein